MYHSIHTPTPPTSSRQITISSGKPGSRSTEFPIHISPNTNPTYQGIEGRGHFIAARLSISMLNPANMEHLSFALKIDENLLFYGMLAWYDQKGTLNPFGVEVTVTDSLKSGPAETLVSITMRLPYALKYHQGIQVAVTSNTPAEYFMESASLNITAFREDNNVRSQYKNAFRA